LLNGLRELDPEALGSSESDSAQYGKVQLVVNKFDPTLHFGAAQIAARLALPLLAVLPARAQALGRAINQGRLLADVAERDPYLRALDPLITRLSGAKPSVEPTRGQAVAVKAGGVANKLENKAARVMNRVLPSFFKRS